MSEKKKKLKGLVKEISRKMDDLSDKMDRLPYPTATASFQPRQDIRPRQYAKQEDCNDEDDEHSVKNIFGCTGDASCACELCDSYKEDDGDDDGNDDDDDEVDDDKDVARVSRVQHADDDDDDDDDSSDDSDDDDYDDDSDDTSDEE